MALPVDVVTLILTYVDPADLVEACCLVSKLWASLLCDETSPFWLRYIVAFCGAGNTIKNARRGDPDRVSIVGSSITRFAYQYLRRIRFYGGQPGTKVSSDRLTVRAPSPVFGWRNVVMPQLAVNLSDLRRKHHNGEPLPATSCYVELEMNFSDDFRLCASGRVVVGFLAVTGDQAVAPTAADIVRLGASEELSWGYASNSGHKAHGTRSAPYGETYTHGDVIGMLVDPTAATISFFHNGQWQGEAFRIPPTGGDEEFDNLVLVPAVSLCFAGVRILPAMDHPPLERPKRRPSSDSTEVDTW